MKMDASVPFVAATLPLNKGCLNYDIFIDDLIDASSKLEVYREKIRDSKLDSSWFMPTLQQKEALASSMMEGTQATLDGVLINQVTPNEKDKNLIEVANYFETTEMGYRYLSRNQFTLDFIKEIHKTLMKGNVRKTIGEIGEFRTKQNYIGKMDEDHAITFTPPIFGEVPQLMENLLDYIVDPKDSLRPLVRAAIIHAQFLTIHPFMDGNGRVGRILIPLYLYCCQQIDLPCFFISEALEKDKFRYYKLLNDIRTDGRWSEWIQFFLKNVTSQCDKYIKMITRINQLYDQDLSRACEVIHSGNIVDIINLLYKYPVVSSSIISKCTDLPSATINRYLNSLVECGILYTDGKPRKRNYFYYDLISIIRD